MKLYIKEQLMWLMMKGTSYKLQWEYFVLQSKYGHLQMAMTLNDCQTILQEINYIKAEIRKKTINFNRMTQEEVKFIKEWVGSTLLFGEADYPSLWYFIPQPPIIIFYLGNLGMLKIPTISIVGTRNISPYGHEVTEKISQAIVENDWILVSGLANGVDKVCHQTAIQAKNLSTIGIIASGFHYFYPKENQTLEEQMYQKHLILSEYLPFTRPQKHHFIMRNRLVAGISKACIVVEAAFKSGSLITANYALQYNRELFVVPGRITDTQSYGCNDLILAGACPIISIEQLIFELNDIFTRQGFTY